MAFFYLALTIISYFEQLNYFIHIISTFIFAVSAKVLHHYGLL